MTVNVRELLTKQRRRSTASVLGFIEDQVWYPSLTRDQRNALRDKVLSAEASYHDVVLDVVSTLDGGDGMHNDRALELLEQIHGLVQKRPLETTRGG